MLVPTLKLFMLALVLVLSQPFASHAGCPAQPTECGTLLRLYDPSGELTEGSRIVIASVQTNYFEAPNNPCSNMLVPTLKLFMLALVLVLSQPFASHAGCPAQPTE